MPPPVVYVVAIVGAVAAAYAFKEFVYEPHIAPQLEILAENFLQRRRTVRNRRAGAVPVPVPASRRRRRNSSTSTSSHPSHDNEDTPLNNSGDRSERALGSNDFAAEAYELDGLASEEVKEWRNEVLRSQQSGNQGLRRRRMDPSSHDFDGFDGMSTTLDESFPSLTHTPLASTHAISNISSPITHGAASLPSTSTGRVRSHSQSTTTQGETNTLFEALFSPPSPLHELPLEASLGSVGQTPRPSVDHAQSFTSPSPVAPLAIPNASTSTPRLPVNDNAPFPLPFTPTYQVMADDSPFGPLLPDTPRSSAEIYSERPFSPISRVMGSSSGSSSVSRGTLSSRASTVGSSRMLGNSGMLRGGSGLVNEVVMNSSDSDSNGTDAEHTSPIEPMPSNADNGTLASIASLSERYPAPPTPPVVVSPPTSSVGIISPPSSPRSGGSEVVIDDFNDFQSPPQTQTLPSVSMLRVPSDPPSRFQSLSPVHSASSPALSHASFLSPLVSRAPSESEGDEFLSVADDESDWGASPPLTSGGRTGPVPDSANNPFLIFEHVSSSGGARENGSERRDESQGSDDDSDDSWGSARRH